MKKHVFVLGILTAFGLLALSNVAYGVRPQLGHLSTGILDAGTIFEEKELYAPAELFSVNTSVEGDNCGNSIDLSAITSPFNSSTTPATNNFSFCGMGWSKDLIFYYDIEVGDGIKIWISWDNYFNRYTLRWGGDCPGEFEVDCIESDYAPIEWINNTGETQRVWFIIAGYYENHGDFTLEWIYFNCEPYDAPFSENFDSSSEMPVCWNYDGTGTFHMGYVSDYYSHSYPNSFYIYQYMATAVLSTPQITEPVQNITLSFWAMLDFGEDKLQIGTLSSPDISTFSEFMTIDLGENWQHYVVSFSDYVGSDNYLGLSYTGYSGSGSLFIDDIEVFYSTSQYNIIAHPNNPEWGIVEGAGNYEYGELVTLTAIPLANCQFVEWQENEVVVSTEPAYEFNVLNNRTLVAVFDIVQDVPQISAAATQVNLYPNPAGKLINISLGQSTQRVDYIAVIDMFGKAVVCVLNPATADVYSLDISRLPPGAYIVRVIGPELITNTRLIVK